MLPLAWASMTRTTLILIPRPQIGRRYDWDFWYTATRLRVKATRRRIPEFVDACDFYHGSKARCSHTYLSIGVSVHLASVNSPLCKRNSLTRLVSGGMKA